MNTPSEINAAYYAMRLLSHRVDPSRLRDDKLSVTRQEEFTLEERNLAFEIIENIQRNEKTLMLNLTELKVKEHLNLLADRVEELVSIEITQAGYDLSKADRILEKLRQSATDNPIVKTSDDDSLTRGTNYTEIKEHVTVSEHGNVEIDSSDDTPGHKDNPQILIVGIDDEAVAKLLALSLERMGYECSYSTSAFEALELAQSKRFDVIIFEIGPPGTDSSELVRRMRDLPSYASVPMIALGSFSNESHMSVREPRFDALLQKPLHPDELLALIERLSS